MNEFARLGVGTLLLGLAIFLSLNFDSSTAVDAMPRQMAEDESLDDSVEPQWQATIGSSTHDIRPNLLPTKLADHEVVRPNFDQPKDNEHFVEQPELAMSVPTQRPQQLPRFANSYQPLRPLTVIGEVKPVNNMVPIQPKPAFTGTITPVRTIHVIRDGDTLHSIARQYFGTPKRYLDIYLLNKDVLSDPTHLPVGSEIRIPAR